MIRLKTQIPQILSKQFHSTYLKKCKGIKRKISMSCMICTRKSYLDYWLTWRVKSSLVLNIANQVFQQKKYRRTQNTFQIVPKLQMLQERWSRFWNRLTNMLIKLILLLRPIERRLKACISILVYKFQSLTYINLHLQYHQTNKVYQ